MTPRVYDKRRRDFFITDNALVDRVIEEVDEKRRADALAVYTVLSRHADKDGAAFPKVDYLRRKTGRSKPTVIDALKELRRVGAITVNRQRRDDGNFGQNDYVLPQLDNPPGQSSLPDQVNSVNRKKNTNRETDTPSLRSGGAEAPRNWFTFYCDKAAAMEYELTEEDRGNVPANLKKLAAEGYEDSFMRRVIVRMLVARQDRGFLLSPQKARDDLLGIDVSKARPGGATDYLGRSDEDKAAASEARQDGYGWLFDASPSERLALRQREDRIMEDDA